MRKHSVLILILAAALLAVPAAAANASVIENTNFNTVQSSPDRRPPMCTSTGCIREKTQVTSLDHYGGYYNVRVVIAGSDKYIVPDLYVKPPGSEWYR